MFRFLFGLILGALAGFGLANYIAKQQHKADESPT